MANQLRGFNVEFQGLFHPGLQAKRLENRQRQRQLISQIQETHMTLTKAELADLLFEQVGFNKREAMDMVDAFFDEVRLTLESGDEVKLAGFGNFQLRNKPQRPGRNPKTGEEIPITARRVVTFHASHKLKATVEATAHDNVQHG
jgi:integration host factor subunit alpha